jgi:hypothetical protein
MDASAVERRRGPKVVVVGDPGKLAAAVGAVTDSPEAVEAQARYEALPRHRQRPFDDLTPQQALPGLRAAAAVPAARPRSSAPRPRSSSRRSRRSRSPGRSSDPEPEPPPLAPPAWKGLGRGVLVDAGIEQRADGTVAIPYRRLDGTVARWRFVSAAGHRWWGPGDGVHLFGAETLAWASRREPVLVCEGESDALAAREAFELAAAVAAPGAGIWHPGWRALLDPFPLVYAIGDGDPPGKGFAWRVRASVPWVRPVVMPAGRDLRDLLQAGEVAEVAGLLEQADWMAEWEAAVFMATTVEELMALVGED